MQKPCREIVKLGLEVGEHLNDYKNFTKYISEHYDISKIDFILITMKPVEMDEAIWYEWAKFFRGNGIYFAFLYTQQRGAPVGKVSHLTKAIVDNIKEIAGQFFVGDMIGETGGLASWYEGYYEDIGMAKPQFADMREAKDSYVEHVASRVGIDKDLGVPAVLAVEATTFNRYNFEAGVDYAFVEMLCGNPEIMFASVRGASKAYGREWWASHIANEWYGGFRNDDPLKYKRLKLAYYYSFMAGAKYIYPESGDISIDSYGYHYSAEDVFCKKYRSVWNDFSDFVRLHGRPSAGPRAKIGFLQGNLDSYAAWGGTTVWNRFGSEAWAYGDPEHGWDYLDELHRSEKWHVPTVYGDFDMTASVPYGLYDIVPAEAPVEVLQQYDCLIFIGWNTMNDGIYKNLKEYVRHGGKLFLSVPHLNTCASRDKAFSLFNDGEYSDFLGCIVRGEGRKLNWGVKFIKDSQMPGYLYPAARDGVCDPICSSGYIRCADISVTSGKVAAVLADKFNGWREDSPPILVENAYGKGFTSLIASWDHPGAVGLSKLYKVLLRAIMAGEQYGADIKVISGDKVQYAVYPDGETGSIVYLLNTDYNLPQKVCIISGGCIAGLDIESCEIALAYIVKGNKKDLFEGCKDINVMENVKDITEDIILVPLEANTDVREAKRAGSELTVEVAGEGEHTLNVFSPGNCVRLKGNGDCRLTLTL